MSNLEPLLNKLMRLVNGWEKIYIPAQRTEMRNLTEAQQARLLVAWLRPYTEGDQMGEMPSGPPKPGPPPPVKEKTKPRTNKEKK